MNNAAIVALGTFLASPVLVSLVVVAYFLDKIKKKEP